MMERTERLAGRRAIVTGGGSGIGRAVALRLAAEGAPSASSTSRDGAADAVAAAIVERAARRSARSPTSATRRPSRRRRPRSSRPSAGSTRSWRAPASPSRRHPRDVPRCVGDDDPRQPHRRLPHRQARRAPPPRGRGRLDRHDRLGRLARRRRPEQRLRRVEGRRAAVHAGSRRRVRRRRHPRQLRLPRPRRHRPRRQHQAITDQTGAPAAAERRPTARRPDVPRSRTQPRSPPPSPSCAPTTPRSSPASPCPSTAASRHLTTPMTGRPSPTPRRSVTRCRRRSPAYYDAIDADRFADAAATFASERALRRPAARASSRPARGPRPSGPQDLLARFTARGPKPWRHVVRLCVADGADALVEGVLVDDAGTATSTFVASARIGDDGLIERYLPSPAPAPATRSRPTSTRRRGAGRRRQGRARLLRRPRRRPLRRRRRPLQRRRPLLAPAVPAHRHRRSRPDRVPRPTGAEAAFHARARRSFDHEVLTSIQRGPHCIFEGAVNDLPDGGTGSFISSLSLAADGTIRRYVSFYCEPAVPMSDRDADPRRHRPYAHTVDERDIDGILGCFAADGRIDFEGGQSSGEGHDGIRKAFEEAFTGRRSPARDVDPPDGEHARHDRRRRSPRRDPGRRLPRQRRARHRDHAGAALLRRPPQEPTAGASPIGSTAPSGRPRREASPLTAARRWRQRRCSPPSTIMFVPVTNRDAGWHRNRAASPMSSG